MRRQRLMYMVGVAAVLSLASNAMAASVLVSSFENGLGGWYTDQWVVGKISLSATGATAGAQAMQIEGPGGWQHLTKVSVKPHLAALAKKGVKFTADVTAFAADMTTTWMQVGMVINAQSNNDNGANNNVGWNQQDPPTDVAIDGKPHTITWTLPDALVAKIGGADDNIGWFELQLYSNVDGTSVVKFYIDNVQISSPDPTSSLVIGDFEGGNLDGWSKAWETTPVVLANATVGATSGSSSLSLTTTDGYWCLQWNAPSIPASLAGTRLQFDLTMIASEWPVNRWTKVADKVALNSDGASGWKEYTTATAIDKVTEQSTGLDWGRWSDTAPDVVKTYTVDISDYVVTGATWFQIVISVQGGNGQAHFYFDNIRLVKPAPTGKSTDLVLGNWEQDMDGWVVGGGANVRYNDHNGVTLDTYSLDIYTETGAWAGVLTMDLRDPNNAARLAAFRANTKITADITHLVADWPVEDIPPWNGTHFIINTDAAAVPSYAAAHNGSGYVDLGYKAGWSRNNGDRTDPVTWDYSQVIGEINANFDKITYLELIVIVNANSADYAGWVLFYLDNMKLSGGGIPLTPRPANAAKDVNTETALRWVGGAYAKSHNLYLGTSSAAVAGAKGDSDPAVLFVPIDGTSFDPNLLKYNTRYFWRVEAVNDVNPDSPWTGPVWNFTTGNFLVVDDFETYTNDSPTRVFQAWIDGYGFSKDEFFPDGNEGNGSDAAVGHDIWTAGTTHLTIMETTTVHGGSQAMPLYYDNKSAGYSEAARTWAKPQDWTVNGFTTMALYIYGKSDNVADPLYIRVEDSDGKAVTMTYDGTAILTTEAWTEWMIPLADLADVNVAAVTKMAIGIGSKTAVSKAAGIVLIDDIRIGFKPLGLVAHYKLDGDLKDSSGNGHDGTLAGDPNFPAKYIAGPTGLGQAMLFEGTGGHQNVELGTFNPSAATGKLTVALWAKWDGASDQWQGLIGKRDSWSLSDMMWHLEVNRDSGTIGFARQDSYPSSGGATLPVGVWTHVAVTFDGTTARFYINGAETGSGGFSFGEDTDSGVHFGSDDPNGGNAFNGALDDIRLYDTALSAAEIKALAGK